MLSTFFTDNISTSEIIDTFKDLNNSKSSGPDIFSPSIIIRNSYLLALPLQHIYNASLETGIYPAKLKIAKVIPIFKKGDSTAAGNYRPISLLSIFNKVFEKIIFRRLTFFFDKHKVLYQHQYGFRKQYSTTFDLINTIDNIYKWMEEGKFTAGIYLDFQKAFDTVNHEILLHKLHHYGIRGPMFKWLTSYLTNRLQYTCINSCLSRTLPVKFGVPQGSVLGPLLFLVYINDICNASELVSPKLFADDTNIFLCDHSLKQLNNKCSTALTQFADWINANKLSLNIDKTNYSIFATNNKKKELDNYLFELKIDNCLILRTKCAKYLGVFIDDSLKWTNHIDFVYKSIIKYIGIFYKLRYKLSTAALRSLYFSTVYPRILYGVEIYGNTCVSFLHDLTVINNKLLRILQFKTVYTPVIELYDSYSTLPVNLLNQFQLVILMHKIIHNPDSVPPTILDLFKPQKYFHNYDTRRNLDIHLDFHATVTGQYCFSFKMGKYWNILPKDIKNENSLSTFKKLLTKLLCSN